MTSSRQADFSPCRRYRWSLRRTWEPSAEKLVMVMLNPSVADANRDDPTTTFCVNVARRHNFGRYEAVNLFPIVGTNPKVLNSGDPFGDLDRADEVIVEAAESADCIVVAWGMTKWSRQKTVRVRAWFVLNKLLRPFDLYCFGKNSDGSPRFPRALAKSTTYSLYRRRRT